MSIQDSLDQKVQEFRLLDHPFYQAWSAGELPVSSLMAYAEEYGAFIGLMPQGWRTLGDAHTAEEEQEHIELWGEFAAGLGTAVAEAKLPEAQMLVEVGKKLFARPETALGALYAFEVQQPETASSKLDGLRQFYDLPGSVEKYFIEHTNNQHEAEKLLARLVGLSESQQEEAVKACGAMSKALWDALSSIHQYEN
jgi:pyrroloquinoline-quinone synthase